MFDDNNSNRLFQVLYYPHISEKSSCMMEKHNVVVFSVDKSSTKIDIKRAVNKLFAVEVQSVRTVVVKGKIKKRGKNISKRCDWKKAYVTVCDGQKIDFIPK